VACPQLYRSPRSGASTNEQYYGLTHLNSFEKSENGYGAYVPDLPGCVAAGETLEETERLIHEAVEFHLEGLREDGLSVPEPSAVTHYVEV